MKIIYKWLLDRSLPNSLDPRPHLTQGVEELASFTGSIMKVKYQQEKFKKRRQDWNKYYYFILSLFYLLDLYDKNNGSHVYTVDVLPSAKAYGGLW